MLQTLGLLVGILAAWGTVAFAELPTQAAYDLLEQNVEVTHAAEFAEALATGNDNVIAAAYSALASPTFWVYRTSLSRTEVQNQLSPDSTLWNWTAYINRSQGERDAWRELFSGPGQTMDASRPNIQPAIDNIFSGTGIAAQQRAHVTAWLRRPATRIEKLLATGTGSTASPAALTYEGGLSAADVALALRGGE